MHLAALSLPERFLLVSLQMLPAGLTRKVESRFRTRPIRPPAMPTPPAVLQELGGSSSTDSG
jgi:hypothetical protein